MAAAPGLLFWLFVLGALWWVPGQSNLSHGRRFSDLKVCGDAECSMLMYRGKALEDFTGPDCRFVNFKKGDDVYVYYKLAGGSPEVWAGSVEHSFGYFPKDLIKVLHKYTEEELHIPADETDFVCSEGGRDDFNSYNVEELLGSLELEDSIPEESKKAEEVSQHREKSPEESRGHELDPAPEPQAVRADSEDEEGAFSESTEELQGQPSAQESHLHANSPAANTQGVQSSLDTFEEILHDKLKVTGSENRTGSSSPASAEQEKTDAYKVLKTEMSLDLKTKFGSTADALVSDDEATRLVTSLEDGFDEELDAEFYPMEDDEEEVEEDTDSSDELPLLTFTDKDETAPGEPMIEKYLTDKDPNLSEKDEVEPATWGDAFFSIVTGGEGKTGVVDLERSIEEEEDVLVSPSHQRKPQSTAGYIDSEEEGDDLFVEKPKTNDVKDSETDPELVITGEEKDIQESRKGLVQPESESEDAKSETASAYHLQSSKLNPLPAAEKGRDFTLKTVFEKKENGLKEPVIHISKETLHEDKTRETQRDSLETELVHRALGNSVTENNKPKSLSVAPLMGNNKPDASKDSTEVPDVLVSGPKAGQQEGFLEPGLKTQNQPRFSSPEETGLSRELGGKVSISGKNLSWQQDQDVAAVVSKHANEKTGFLEEESREDRTDEEQPRTTQRPQEAESPEVLSVQPGRPDAEVLSVQPGRPDAEVLSVQPGRPDAEEEEEEDDDNYPPEGLLEDENAVSAQQSRENYPSAHDGRSDMNSKVFKKVIFGTLNLNTEKTKQAPSMILETGQKRETTSEEAGDVGKESRSVVVDSEESHLADVRAQRPSQVHGLHDETAAQTPGSREAVLSKNPNDLQKDNPEEELVNTLGLEDPGVEEILEGELEDTKEFGVSESQGTDAEDLRDDPSQRATPEIPDIVLKSIREDLPIINSFFKDDQQSLHRFLKYFDVRELEGLLQDMSIRLRSAHQESLPYNMEKVLDKVFRASESLILSTAEKMLDTGVAKNRDLGSKESSPLEEAEVLDDIQDLIYFVRYQYSGVETAPLVTPPPLEEGWAGPGEEMQPPQQDSLPQENTGNLSVQLQKDSELLDQPVTSVQPPEEPDLFDQPVTGYTSTSEVSQKPNTEKDIDLGPVMEGDPVGAEDVQKQLETIAEEPATVPPLESAFGSLYAFILYLSKMLLATLPDNVQPGPDFYGLPWQPVIITAVLGIVSFAIFSWRTILVVKSRVYQVTEKQISEKLENIKKENAELTQKLSSYEQKIKESKKYVQETKKQNMILSDEAVKYKDKIKILEETNVSLGDKAKSLRLQLESEREQNVKNQDLILENKKSIEKLKNVISMNASELSEVQVALNEAKLSEENVKSECHRVQEENARLKKKKEQLQQQIEEWSKSHAELTEQIKSSEKSQEDLEVALTHKDDNISALTNCITQLNRLECELESEDPDKGGNESDDLANGEMGGDRSEKIKNRIKQMMDVSRTQTAVSIVEEDLKLLQLKLRASMSTKCNLEDQIKKLEDDRNSLQTAKAGLEDECKTLRQKVEILNELYQQKEMALQKKLSQEEYERQDREQRLTAADEKVVLAAEEVKTYKRRIEEMEEELQKTERSFKNQIAAHEKKAHDNWLKARAAERAMAEEKREAANLRHKLLEMTQKMAMRQDEPVIVKPMPGRPNTQNPPRRGLLSQNGSFGPSPVSGGECSPPLPAEPPGRPLSATLSRRDTPRSEFGSLDRHLPRPRWPSEASGKHSASDPGPAPVVNSSSRSSSPAKAVDEGKVNMAPKGPPPFPGVPLMGGPVPPPIRYGPPPQLCGPFGPRPLPPPFVPGMRPPLGVREYAPGVLPGKRDLPVDPREFLPGHTPFRPPGSLGPREFFIPGTRLPPPTHGPQEYPPPPPAVRDSLPSGPREEAQPASPSSVQDRSQASKPTP